MTIDTEVDPVTGELPAEAPHRSLEACDQGHLLHRGILRAGAGHSLCAGSGTGDSHTGWDWAFPAGNDSVQPSVGFLVVRARREKVRLSNLGFAIDNSQKSAKFVSYDMGKCAREQYRDWPNSTRRSTNRKIMVCIEQV